MHFNIFKACIARVGGWRDIELHLKENGTKHKLTFIKNKDY